MEWKSLFMLDPLISGSSLGFKQGYDMFKGKNPFDRLAGLSPAEQFGPRKKTSWQNYSGVDFLDRLLGAIRR